MLTTTLSGVIIAVVLLLATSAALAAAAATSDKNFPKEIEWKRHPFPTDSVPDTEPLNFQLRFWLPLRNTFLARDSVDAIPTATLSTWAQEHDGGCSGDFFGPSSSKQLPPAEDVVGRRLHYWRQITAPSCEQVATAKQSLVDAHPDLGKYCFPTENKRDAAAAAAATGAGARYRYDAFFCSMEMPVGVARSALGPGVEFERFREVMSGDVRLSVKKKHGAAEPTMRSLAGIDHITNHVVGAKDAQPQPGRRRPRARRPSIEELLAQQKQRHPSSVFGGGGGGGGGGVSASSTAVEERKGTWFPRPNSSVDGNAPQLLSFPALPPTTPHPGPGQDPGFWIPWVQTDLHCADGSPAVAVPNATNASQLVVGCAGNDTQLPDSIDVEVIDKGGKVVAAWGGLPITDNCKVVPPAEADAVGWPHNSTGCQFMLFTRTSRGANGTGGTIHAKDLNSAAGPWQSIFPRVRARFGADYSPYSYAKSFWAGRYYNLTDARVFASVGERAYPSGYQPTLPQHGAPKNLSVAFATTGWALFPQDYAEMYNSPSTKKPLKHRVAQAMFEAGYPAAALPYVKTFDAPDVDLFMNRTGAAYDPSRVIYLGGSPNASNAVNAESQLDMQTMLSMTAGSMDTVMLVYNLSHGQVGEYFSLFSDLFEDILADEFFGRKFNHSNRPVVHSCSYGFCVTDSPYNKTTTQSILQRQQAHVALASSSGIQVFFSSGDTSSSCSDGPEEIMAQYPALLSHVVAVGATMIGEPNRGDEWTLPPASARQVCDTNRGALIGSGGGPAPASLAGPRPQYQAARAKCPYPSFIAWGANNCSKVGKFVPDISYVGTSVFAVVHGQNTSMAGTSFSAPAVASSFALIASKIKEEEDSGGDVLSNIAAFIYSSEADGCWRDVTRGTSCYGRGPNQNYLGVSSCYGAKSGYDWVSGLGEFDDWQLTLEAARRWTNSRATTSTSSTSTTSSIATSTSASLPSSSTSSSSTTTTTTTSPSTTSETSSTSSTQTSSTPTAAVTSTSSSTSTTATPSTTTTTTTPTTTTGTTGAPPSSPTTTTTTTSKGGHSGASSDGSGGKPPSNSSSSSISVAELVAAAIGSLFAGLLLGALLMRWKWNRSARAEQQQGSFRYTAADYRDELSTQA